MQKNLVAVLFLLAPLLIGTVTDRYFSMPAPTKVTLGGGVVGEIPLRAHVITLTKDGFSPSEITIKKGETIAFNTTTQNLFWPASNLHPSHLLYPEFDPKEPVQPDESWSFVFDKVGQWRFHDHLAPYFTGTITVTE